MHSCRGFEHSHRISSGTAILDGMRISPAATSIFVASCAKDLYQQICSSQWTPEEQTEANSIATKVVPGIKIVNIPSGLDSKEGGDATVKFLLGAVKASGIPSLSDLPQSA